MLDEGKTRVWIVHERENPSTDYYIKPRFDANSYVVSCCLFTQVPEKALLANSIVVFVRYLPKLWRICIEQNEALLKDVIYFMDDDLLDWRATAGMPMRYRLKLLKQVTFYQSWLRKNIKTYWLSTPYLQKKYSSLDSSLVEPLPLREFERGLTVFYHGSNSHHAEVRWLYPVIEQVLKKDPSISFELIGDEAINKIFRPLERVQVMNYLTWPAYQQWLLQSERHIGLAPLVDHPFNRARACVKFYDITRAGAVGIYAEESECGRSLASQEAGIVLPMDQHAWVNAILWLARDSSERNKLWQQAVVRMKSL